MRACARGVCTIHEVTAVFPGTWGKDGRYVPAGQALGALGIEEDIRTSERRWK